MKKKRSTIPDNLQVPMAIVLAVLFAIILAWRFWPAGEADPEAGGTSAASSRAGLFDSDVIRLRGLVSELQRKQQPPEAVRAPAREVAGNPFDLAAWERPPEPLPVPTTDLEFLAEPQAYVAPGPSREERLARLTLSATMRRTDFSMALVNDRYLRPGDEIEGFKVKAVHEKYIVLMDRVGELTLPIAAPPLFDMVPEPNLMTEDAPES